jgi:polar amino acid transport system substrate-binding protein
MVTIGNEQLFNGRLTMARWVQIVILWATVLAGAPSDAAAPSEPMRIVTSDLPPFSQDGTPEAPGALHETVAELLRRTRLPASIKFVPFQRALTLTTSQANSAIFPLTRSPERESRYRWLVQLYQGNFVFMSTKNSHFDVRQPALGKERRIGVMRGSVMIKLLKDSGYLHIVEASSVDENMRLLRRGMVDAVAGERAIYRNSLKGRDQDNYPISAPIITTGMWLGGSLDVSDADAALLQKAMKEMIDDGSYTRILKKYALNPTP